MKILIGICGIGNGHLNRQTSVIELLLENNHDILIATTKENISYFNKKFKNLNIEEIVIPWIFCNDNGIDFKNTLIKYNDNNEDLFRNFLLFSKKVEEYFQGGADLVITDYEPNVAQYSYALDIPLICMEQQSKFLYIDEIKIKNYSIQEEKKRINYFFPKFDYKIISSFFPISIKDKKIKIVSPIISKLNEKSNKKNHVVVYFSPYETSDNYKTILSEIRKIKEKEFIVYTKENYTKYSSPNITFKTYSFEFKKDLEDAACLISTAGHQLLSEAISISIPVYLIPLSTYEQNYNAKMIEKYNLGKISKNRDVTEIKSFLSDLAFYSNNISLFRNKYYKNSWQEELLKTLDSINFKKDKLNFYKYK